MRILVTGSEGFVGRATTEHLQRLGHKVVPYDAMLGDDIRDEGHLKRQTRGWMPDRILHLAAIARFADADQDPTRAFETNVIGSRNVASVASALNIPMVYASTGSVYMPINQEPPITEDFPVSGNSVYGVTKLLGELEVRKCSAPWIILRYAHLYGAEKRLHGLVGSFIDRIERGLAPKLYGGRQSNDFTYIADVARANALALESWFDAWNQIYNIGTGEELRTEDAANLIRDAWGYDGPVRVEEQRSVDPQRFVYDISKAERMLGFRPNYSFAEGLGEMRHGLSDLAS